MIYLAAPYSHKDPTVVADRIKTFCKIDSELSSIPGIVTVSPLLKHLLFINGSSLPTDWEFWKTYSYGLLLKCDSLIVITLHGWDESPGVSAEIEFAKSRNFKILMLDPNKHTVTQFWDWALRD